MAGHVWDNGKRREKAQPRYCGQDSLAKWNAAPHGDGRQAGPEGRIRSPRSLSAVHWKMKRGNHSGFRRLPDF